MRKPLVVFTYYLYSKVYIRKHGAFVRKNTNVIDTIHMEECQHSRLSTVKKKMSQTGLLVT